MPAQIFYYGNALIYVTDEEGIDHVVDNHFYEYLVMRKNTPKKVILYYRRRDLKAALAEKGVSV